MANLFEVIDFYGEKAWERTAEGVIIPTAALLEDKGKKALSFKHPSEGGIPPENVIMSSYLISAAEISEALRDLMLAINIPPGQTRGNRIGACCARLQDAEFRMRKVTRND